MTQESDTASDTTRDTTRGFAMRYRTFGMALLALSIMACSDDTESVKADAAMDAAVADLGADTGAALGFEG